VAAAFDVPSASAELIGHSQAELEPLWWCGWARCSAGAPDTRAAAYVEGLPALFGPDGPAEQIEAIRVWNQLLSVRATRASSANAVRFADALARTKVPLLIDPLIKKVAHFSVKYAIAWNSVFRSPNACFWGQHDSHVGSLQGAVDARPQLSDAERTQKSLTESHAWNPRWRLPQLCRSVSEIVQVAEESTWVRRLELWSAIHFVRAQMYHEDGEYLEALISAQRSIESYAYSIGLEEELLAVDVSGRFSWGRRMSALGRGGALRPEMAELLRQLNVSGRPLSPSVGTLKDLVYLRNRSLFGHGFVCPNHQASETALSVVSSAIEGSQPSPSTWAREVKQLAMAPDFKRLPQMLFAELEAGP
jgi:hypothetical protein